MNGSTFAAERALAGRGQRLGAALIDSFALLFAALPGLLLAYVNHLHGELLGLGILAAVVGFLALLAYQIFLLATEGQTVGKRALNLRIVRYEDDVLPGFFRAVALRGVVPGLIGSIPMVGPIFTVVNVLFIFGEERRCIHDYIAGTKVVSEEAG